MKTVAAIAATITAMCACATAPAPQGAARDTANTVSLDPNAPDSYRAFAPELADTLARAPKIDPDTGVHASEVKPDLFWVTDGIYQSAFVRTGQGIIVFDAPASLAEAFFDEIMRYDFDTILTGHTAVLGTKEDAVVNREYVHDVRDTASRGMQTMLQMFEERFATLDHKNGNLAYRMAIETVRGDCTRQIIDRWTGRLSAVDVWAHTHARRSSSTPSCTRRPW